MRQHHTKEEKEIRKQRYKMLRDSGIHWKASIYLRDWSDSKINQILSGEARPTILEVYHVENS